MSGFEGMVSLRPAQAVTDNTNASLGEVAGATFAETLASNPSTAYYREKYLENAYAMSPDTVDAASARERLKTEGLEGRLQIPEQGIPRYALDTLIDRKREEVKRQDVLSRAPPGIASKSVRLAVGLGGSLLDPLNVAAGFFPVVGEARYAQLLARAPLGIIGRTAVRAGVGAVEGTAGAAAIEPLVYSSKQADQADYSMGDSLANIAFGGVFGAGLHTMGGALGELGRTIRGGAADVAANVDPATRATALKTAVAQAVSGEPVNVEPLIKLDPASQGIPRAEDLAPPARAIEDRFRGQVSRDPDAAIAAYEKLPDSNGGQTLNTDIARELSPDYLADRSQSAAVHEPASWLVKEMYTRKLAQAEPGGTVVFSAGGTGAGKTTGLVKLGLQKELVYDTNMSSLKGAVDKIQQALDAKQNVHIVYTYRDPVEALTGGALKRAMRQESEHGTGRTVPLGEHEKTHVGSRDVIQKLTERYKDDPRVQFDIVDNSRGKDRAEVVPLDQLPQIDYNAVGGKLDAALEAQRQSGAISDTVYRGFQRQESGLQPEVSKRQRNELRSEVRGGPESGGAGRQVDLSAVHEAAREPKLSIVADERASAQADRALAEPVPPDDLARVQQDISDETARLKEAGVDTAEELAPYDEAIKDAQTYAKAARAAVLCGLAHVA